MKVYAREITMGITKQLRQAGYVVEFRDPTASFTDATQIRVSRDDEDSGWLAVEEFIGDWQERVDKRALKYTRHWDGGAFVVTHGYFGQRRVRRV